MAPKVFVIILNYQGRETLVECIRSVFSSDYPNLEIVVVDNASKDGSFEEARMAYPRAHFIGSTWNRGFAAGNNLGIRFALEKGADYVFLLNNDAFVDRNTIAELVREAKKTDAPAVLSPLVYSGKSPSKDVWFSGGRIDWARMKALHDDGIAHSEKGESYETEYVTGCAMLVHKEIFRSVGLLDERYFLYYEDADFCVSAQRAGFSNRVVPKASTYHLESSEGGNPRKLYWLVVSGILFFRKNTPGTLKPRMELYLLMRRCKNYLDRKKNRLSKEAAMVFEAYRDVRKARNIRHNRELPQL